MPSRSVPKAHVFQLETSSVPAVCFLITTINRVLDMQWVLNKVGTEWSSSLGHPLQIFKRKAKSSPRVLGKLRFLRWCLASCNWISAQTWSLSPTSYCEIFQISYLLCPQMYRMSTYMTLRSWLLYIHLLLTLSYIIVKPWCHPKQWRILQYLLRFSPYSNLHSFPPKYIYIYWTRINQRSCITLCFLCLFSLFYARIVSPLFFPSWQ